jgi:anti-sigma factor RsiW
MCENEKMQLLISGHLDGCNTPEEERALQEHLARCPDCRQALKEYERIDALLRSIPPAEAPEGLTERIMQAVEAEPRRSEPVKKRKLPFGFATAAAAVAAVLILAVSGGWLPGLNNGSAKLFASKSADAELPTSEAEPAYAVEPEAIEEPAAIAPDAAYSAATETPAGLPANVDAQALADAEFCPVGVLWADPAAIPELEGKSSLPLSGGLRYTLRQSELNAIAEGYDVTVYTPESYTGDDNGRALLIVVTE